MYGYGYKINSSLVVGSGGGGGGFTNTYSTQYDGVDDYIDTGIPNLSGTDFTISYWFKTTATFANYTYYCPFSAVSNQAFVGAYLFNRPTELLVICKNSSGSIPRGTTNLKDGNWHHIASTYNSTTKNFKTYVDGSLELDETIVSYALFNQDLLIGGKTPSLYLIDCFIDEAAYWHSELTSVNITDIYNSGAPGDLSSLSPLGWWRFEEGSGTTATDSGSGGNDGTLINGVAYSTDIP